MRSRFAPSPTGLLHLGHAFAAKVAFDLAKDHGGEFLLRFEDIDTTRVREEYYGKIEQDLRWLGLDWSGTPLRQTHRLGAYQDALGKLKSTGVIYPCFCTRKEIQQEIASISNAPHGPEGPLYPGTCRALSEVERTEKMAAGHAHCWRLDAVAAAKRTGQLAFDDEVHGKSNVDHFMLGDVILARKDIATSYHLAVVIDDAFQEITHVSRGEDLLASTHVHRVLQNLLGLPAPVYHHHRLIVDRAGNRLAKRDASLSISTLREQGESPKDVLSRLLILDA